MFTPDVFHHRITSTYVEKTNIDIIAKHPCWDHLHLRGENQDISDYMAYNEGITSTYVEKTCRLNTNNRNIRDHLHLRGENSASYSMPV